MQRKGQGLLESWPIEEMQDQEIEPDLKEFPPDDPPDVEILFDPDETLPYMLGDDPELLENDNQFEFFNSQVPAALPRTTRTGRKINIPACFRDF